MIYLRLHQARSEKIERGASREISLQERENFATIEKFSLHPKFRYCNEISLQVAKFSLATKIHVPFFFLCTNDPVFG